MRKDKGLNGDADRLPQLTWIMFLKFLDDLESQAEVSSQLTGEDYQGVIPAPYRWRDWAVPRVLTGPSLLSFVANDEVELQDGSRGPGLFMRLQTLQGETLDDRRSVISRVFSGTTPRLTNGYILRDVVNKVDEINFSASEEVHTLSALYESMLKEMRDASGDAGEFYTPRPVVRMMVDLVAPTLGETVLDPACGTGGFLAESYEYLKHQVASTDDWAQLQGPTLFGNEAKPLPYLLCEMNLLLHGLDVPKVTYGNSLVGKLSEIGDRDRVDVILTNPPFGGEEEER